MDGYIRLHRKLMDSAVFQNPNLLKVWIWCLLKASYAERETLVGLQPVKLEAGQFVFGKKAAAVELEMNESAIYRFMKTLESVGMITRKANSKFTLVTVEKWAFYQSDESNVETQMKRKRNANETQMNTNKKDKKEKKIRESGTSATHSLDFVQYVEAWNSIPNVVSVKAIKAGTQRAKALKARIEEYGEEDVLKAIEEVKGSAFLRGLNDRSWKATFDWLMKPSNFVKVLEGSYRDAPEDKPNALEYYTPGKPKEATRLPDEIRQKMMEVLT